MKEDYIRLIFGLKMKQIRSGKELSLFKLSKLTGLSKSYLNEIEKGKKYPKTDKILLLAKAFDVNYDDLVSLKLDKNLAPVAEILQSDLLKEIPLDIFGIEERDLIDIIANAPAKVGAFISTLLEIGKNYNLSRENFFLAALRSFQEANDNHFPEIEKSVKDFLKAYKIDEVNEFSEKWLERILAEEYGYTIINDDFSILSTQSKFHMLRSIYIAEKRVLYINRLTDKDQRCFILAKEIGYNFLNLKERLNTYPLTKFTSFDELLNNFYASYFAGALLIPEDRLVRDLKELFLIKHQDLGLMNKFFKNYTQSPETIYQRLTNVMSKNFNIKDLFFIRFEHERGTDLFRLTKELHLNKHQSPHANEIHEHYCRRWVSVRVIEDFEKESGKEMLIDAQISVYPYHNYRTYYVFSTVIEDSLNPSYLRSVTLGILLSQAKKKVNFLADENIPIKEVAVTCENCGIENCTERAAAPLRFDKSARAKKLNEEIDKFINSKK